MNEDVFFLTNLVQAKADTKPGSLLFAIQSLHDSQYAKQTITPRGKTDQVCVFSPVEKIIADIC